MDSNVSENFIFKRTAPGHNPFVTRTSRVTKNIRRTNTHQTTFPNTNREQVFIQQQRSNTLALLEGRGRVSSDKPAFKERLAQRQGRNETEESVRGVSMGSKPRTVNETGLRRKPAVHRPKQPPPPSPPPPPVPPKDSPVREGTSLHERSPPPPPVPPKNSSGSAGKCSHTPPEWL